VGSGVAIFTRKVLKEQLNYKLDNRCTNNLAEVKALKAIEMQRVEHNVQKTVVIYMDRRISMESTRNATNHNYLVGEIRKRISDLNKKNWKIEFKQVKAHVGIYSIEIAD
jgi:ribonuclease HI